MKISTVNTDAKAKVNTKYGTRVILCSTFTLPLTPIITSCEGGLAVSTRPIYTEKELRGTVRPYCIPIAIALPAMVKHLSFS